MESIESLSTGKAGFTKWREEVREICGRFDSVAPGDSKDFFGRIARKHMHGLEFADVATNAHSLRKDAADVRAEDGRHYFLIYQQSGSAVLCQHGKQALLRAGDCTLIDSRYASEFFYLESTRHLSFHLPCDELEQRLKSLRPRVCEVLPGSGAAGAVLGGFISEIATRHSQFGEREGAAMAEALLAMLSPLADEGAAPARRLHGYPGVLAYIDGKLADDLSPETIARAVGVSVRALYRLFEERDISPSAYIRTRRLERCAQELRAQDHHAKSLTEIAFRWGFKDSAHFSRSFRAHFGMTPKDYRRLG